MNNDLLTVIAHVRARRGHEARVRDVLLGLIELTRAEAGCLRYDLHESRHDPSRFVFYETWSSAAHLEAHSRSPHIQAFRALEPEMLDGPVDITRWTKL